MIKDVISNGQFIQVMGAGSSSPYVNMSNSSAGMLRWNGNSQNFEVYDGSSWMTIYSNVASVSLTHEAVTAIEWAKQKMSREQKLKSAAEKYEAVKLLSDQITDLQEKLEVMMILVDEHQG